MCLVNVTRLLLRCIKIQSLLHLSHRLLRQKKTLQLTAQCRYQAVNINSKYCFCPLPPIAEELRTEIQLYTKEVFRQFSTAVSQNITFTTKTTTFDKHSHRKN